MLVKNALDILSQLEKIHFRYMQYNKFTARKISDILEHFCEYQDEFGEHPRKMMEMPIKKIYDRRSALQQFNKEHNTKYGIIDYLHQSSIRGSYIKTSTFLKIQKNIELLYGIGFTQEEVEKRLLQPGMEHYFNYTIERNQKYIVLLKEQLHRQDDEIKDFLMRFPFIFTYNIELITKKIQHLIVSGYNLREEVKKIFIGYPRFYTHSIQRLSGAIDTISNIATRDLLLEYPILLYFNPHTEFFKRVIKGVYNNQKRYLSIIDRMNTYHANVQHLCDKIIPGTGGEKRTNQSYLNDLCTGIYKSDFYFTTLQEKKALVFERCKYYLGGGEIQFLGKIFDKKCEGGEITDQEIYMFQLIMKKITHDIDLYNDIRNIFEYKKIYLPF